MAGNFERLLEVRGVQMYSHKMVKSSMREISVWRNLGRKIEVGGWYCRVVNPNLYQTLEWSYLLMYYYGTATEKKLPLEPPLAVAFPDPPSSSP